MVRMGPKYKVPRRRRREGKTNYKKRYRMVLSKKTRFVVRKTLKYIDIKLVDFDPKGDRVRVAAHSSELVKKYGWKGSTSSIVAAYLTGYLAGLRALEKGIKQAILDIGLYRPVPGSKVFAAVKGALDAGMEIPVSQEVLPPEEKIKGEHIAKWALKLKEEKPEFYERQFSKFLEKGFDPTKYPEEFDSLLEKMKKEV